jgi:hypothetical protein
LDLVHQLIRRGPAIRIKADINTKAKPNAIDIRATRLDSAILGPEKPVIVSVIVIKLNNICARF